MQGKALGSGHLVKNLMWLFAFMYVAEGACQVSHINGLLHQPLAFYCKDVFGWDTDKTSAFVSLMVAPWCIKPFFGLLSDFVPLFGYRRKSYLLLANLAATAAFIWLWFVSGPTSIVVALAITTIAMTMSSTLCGALLVENGKATGMTSRLQGQQGLWFGIASCTACVGGGWLCKVLSPSMAFHVAAVVSALAPLAVAIVCWPLIHEERVTATWGEQREARRETRMAIWQALNSRALWTVALFLALWSFNPGFGHPLMFWMRNKLQFGQELIGYLNAIYAAGAAIGAVFFVKVASPRLSSNRMVLLSICCGAIAQGSFLLLSGPASAAVLHFFNGATTSLALLTMHVLAANACPSKAEGFVYALVLSASNLSWNISQSIGGYLFAKQFDHQITPLILLSAGTTACCLFLLPFFNFNTKAIVSVSAQATA